MKKLFFTLLTLLLPYCLSAQTDKAKVVLDKVISTFTEEGGIQIDFEGTEKGTIVMKEKNSTFIADKYKAGMTERRNGAMWPIRKK